MPMMDHEEFLNQKHQVLDGSQGHASLNTGHYSWPSSTGQVSVSWNSYPKDNNPIENGTPASSAYYYDPQKITVSGDAQGEISTASHASTSSSLGEANITQGYTGYTDFSGYHTAGFQNYYYGYQQPAIDSSSQQVVASQNSGAPYQPLSSFQNAGSYVSPTSYSGTHYNTGDHQTTAGYNYSNQTNIWNDANSGSYPLHNYSSYTSAETNSTPTTSSVATNPLHYQQQPQYNQWSFYNASAPIVSCAPGTENTYATTASATACPVQNGSGSYPYPSNQPPPPGTTSWGRDSGSSGVPSLQVTEDVMTYNRKNGWEVGAPGYQNNQMPLYFQKPFDSASPHKNCEDQQKPLYFQVPSSQYPNPPIFSTNQVSEKFQTPLQTVTTVDTRRVSKMQIPTNPRIASNLALGVPKTDKESSTTNAAMKPAYVSVSVPKLTKELSSHVDEAMIKGTFPTSLRAYVERTFARCKDDAQRAANQNKMKEMITKASADGSLFTRNWDVEPLFSLPNISDMGDQNNVQSSVTVSSLPKYRRSPNRRTKSRWEPIAEETLVEKLESATNSLAKDLSWDNLKATEKAVDSSKFVNKDSYWNGGVKFVLSHHQTPTSKIAQRSVKKQRFADSSIVMGNGDASSDSDKDQSLTKYYASAIALADTPDEKKRREHRSKRFEKGHENQTEVKHIRAKSAGSENTYIRRASAVVLTKNSEDSCSRAVEDIDWDAHTVKGTSQEVEKRYLRLTSAPDPATVRPEEVLEKALHVVQTSSRNYLYKCDQLKSIRQDLTVQRIQNELTVKVYETHARLALESGDLPEYNQCQSQLNSLYAEGIKGAHMEFSAYNLLCVILHSNNYRELLSSMARLSDEAKENDAVKHALAVRSAVSSGNYILFFRLYKSAPNLNTCLMDLYVERIRFEAVKCMSKSYRPSVPVTYIARILSFSSAAPRQDGRDIDGLEECKEWLRAHGGTLTVDNNGELQLDTKVSSSSLYMPDPEDAVAHGDASLAVNDFLTRAS